jgi:hypothetical protein
MLGSDLSSFDCQPEGDATHVKVIRSLGKSEPAFGPATVGVIWGDAVMAA